MNNFANLTAMLNLNINNFTKNMRTASATANKFATNLSGQINSGMADPAKKSKIEFKDVARIVQGIIVSKVFYSGLNAIRKTTDAVWEFAQALEYSKMIYTNLFGDKSLAEEFINVLKDFSAVTPFTFEQSEAAAKRLLAYGIEYKNVMFVMQGVLAAATVQGNYDVIERVSRALGQIYTKGRLMGSEVRQLAEAGIPAYAILGDKLGITAEQIQNLGREAIPANEAINALVEGITERFGGALEESALTTQGVISNLKDNSLMLFAGLSEGIVERFKHIFLSLGDFVNELRGIVEISGIGGVFERLVLPQLQASVKTLIINFKMLWDIIKTNLVSIFNVLKDLLVGIMHAFNAMAPILIAITGAFTILAKFITSNATLMKVLTAYIMAAASAWLFFKLKALSALIITKVASLITTSISGISKALTLLVSHPIWGVLALAVGVLVALSVYSDKFRESISKVFNLFRSQSGITDILLPDSENRANSLDKFNEVLGDTASGMADLTEEATKATKSLLSFDEVFSLSSPSAPDESFDEYAGLFDDLEALDFSTFKAALPDVLESTENFIDNMIDLFAQNKELLSTSIGALVGGAIGGIAAGPGGALIGAAIGGLAGWVWDTLAEKLSLSDDGKFSVPLAAGIGGIIGALVGGAPGALIGVGIGSVAAWFWDQMGTKLELTDEGKLALPIGAGIGAAVGFAIGGAPGAIIGTAIGTLAAWFWDEVINKLEISDFSKVAIPIGAGIGGAIGFAIGGVPGAIIGTAIGILTAWVWDKLTEELGISDYSKVAIPIGTVLGGAIGYAIGGVPGALVGSAIGGLAAGIWDIVADKLNLSDFTKIAMPIGSGIGAGIGFLIGGPAGAVIGLAIGNLIAWIVGLIVDNWEDIKKWFTEAWDWLKDIGKNIGVAFEDMWEGVKKGIANLGLSFKNWIDDLWTNVFGKLFGWLDTGISKLREFFGLEGKPTNTFSVPVLPSINAGHSVGGVFNKEHLARFAEGNKAEAIIPLENNSAMQPFVDAVTNGLTSVILPLISSQQQQLRPIYVGTLIADERSLKELNKKMHIIQLEEEARRG